MIEGTLYKVVRLPSWPPPQPHLIFSSSELELVGLIDGRLRLYISSSNRVVISQGIDTNTTKPRWDICTVVWTASGDVTLYISGIALIEDAPGVPTVVLPLQPSVPDEVSTNEPTAAVMCQEWIQNRAAMFRAAPTPRRDRRSKSRVEQITDLRNSILRLRYLTQQIAEGNTFLLGTLAGEMRASVYWPKGKDTEPPRNYNPLLLRMANIGRLPLPVYFVPEPKTRETLIADAVMTAMLDPPRLHREFLSEQVRDLQESLITTVLRLGKSPGRIITALELIKELAHTDGASHYDEDASEFVETLQQIRSSRGHQVTIFTCQIAETLASLSEWVLSELTKRNLTT